MKVFVTGGSGFVGQIIVDKLISSGHQVSLLTRNPNNIRRSDLILFKGDIRYLDSFAKYLKGHDAVIHLVGIIRQYPYLGITFENLHLLATQNILKAAKEAKIKRYLHMSALGVDQVIKTKYFQTKELAEKEVAESNLDWTIFRPSIIFGPKDKSINTFAKLIKTTGLVPVFGDKTIKIQPIYVNDVAEIFVQSLNNDKIVGKILSLCGPKIYTFKDLILTIAKILGKKVKIIPIPKNLAKLVVMPFDNLPLLPVTSEAIEMLNHDNICGGKNLDFGYRQLESEIKKYLIG